MVEEFIGLLVKFSSLFFRSKFFLFNRVLLKSARRYSKYSDSGKPFLTSH